MKHLKKINESEYIPGISRNEVEVGLHSFRQLVRELSHMFQTDDHITPEIKEDLLYLLEEAKGNINLLERAGKVKED